ncbi:putative O-methyltransferase [Poronia punctata]|nr:putative O-methyltransferase [Poronia punctata]
MSSSSEITSLGKQVADLSSQISAFLQKKSFPEPTLEPGSGQVPEDVEYESLRASLNDAALDLLHLVNGPKTTLRDIFFSHYDLAALQVAFDRGFFKHVPLPDKNNNGAVESITVAEVAAKADMDVERTGSILKILASRRIFQQVVTVTGDGDGDGNSDQDRFRHSSVSASLASDEDWRALGDMKLDDMFRASSELSTLVTRSPHKSSAVDSAFQQRFGAPVYQYYEKFPEKGKRFAQAMSSWSKVNERGTELRDNFAWASLGDGKVVDVGGGSGHISIGLAKEFPSLNFVVQDVSPIQLTHGQDNLSGRITFQQHDFFQQQPITDASAFLLRQILHNYNDEDASKILRALVPALEKCGPETAVLINDVVLPEPGAISRFEEHLLRQADVSMMVVLGAKQRSRRDFAKLFHDVDPRFEIVDVRINPLGVGLLHVHLRS